MRKSFITIERKACRFMWLLSKKWNEKDREEGKLPLIVQSFICFFLFLLFFIYSPYHPVGDCIIFYGAKEITTIEHFSHSAFTVRSSINSSFLKAFFHFNIFRTFVFLFCVTMNKNVAFVSFIRRQTYCAKKAAIKLCIRKGIVDVGENLVNRKQQITMIYETFYFHLFMCQPLLNYSQLLCHLVKLNSLKHKSCLCMKVHKT